MKAPPTPSEMTFGEFIVSIYDAWSEPGAALIVSLALDAGLIVFRRPECSHRLPENTRIEFAAPPWQRFANSN
jgi:hypothetical protein